MPNILTKIITERYHRFLKHRLWPNDKTMFAIGLSLLFILALIGPWPTDDTYFTHGQYAQETLLAVEQTDIVPTTGPLQVGIAIADITPAYGAPLAGFSARRPKENTGALSKLAVKAISFHNGITTLTIVSGDFLLPLPLLVEQVLAKTGLARENVYFASTHTHSGPGGYAMGLVDEMVLGEFNETQFKLMVDRMSQTIIDSRTNLQPAQLNYLTFIVPELIASTLLHSQFKDQKAHARVQIIQVLNRAEPAQAMGLLLSFNAHATFLGRDNHKASADYPGVLQEQLEQQLGIPVIFMAGAVGGLLPVTHQKAALDTMAQKLAQLILDHIHHKTHSTDTTYWNQQTPLQLASAIIPVQLPSPQYVWLEDALRFSPYLVRLLFHNDTTYLHLFNIGPIVLLGFPGDFSGALAKKIEADFANEHLFAWITSFNGDYIGYIMPNEHYQIPHYTTRTANFYGPWLGEYFATITQALAPKLIPTTND